VSGGKPGHPVLELTGVRREYLTGNTTTVALDGVDLRVDDGEFVAIVGPSGSGKSTLMNLIGCLDRPSSGRLRIAGHDVADLDDDQVTSLRGQAIGFVFQAFNLLPRTSALDNVAAPLLYQGVRRADARRRAEAALRSLGLGERLSHDRTELSGGQQQRVAIARALVTDPAIVLADEPTGALDSVSGAHVLQLLSDLHTQGRTIVLITHDPDVAAAAGRVVRLKDGRIASDERQQPVSAAAPVTGAVR
jgi:putative ABC transport system ATP-binding protein